MKSAALPVLLIEDNAGDARLIREALADGARTAGGDTAFALEHASRLGDGLTRLARGDVGIVLLDLSLPDSHGLVTLERVRRAAPEVALLVLTGLDDEHIALQAVAAGAQDYLVKTDIVGENGAIPFVRALRYAAERQRLARELDATRRRELETKDQFLSHVSHELRSPLTAVHQFVGIVLDGLAGDLNPEQREYLQIVQRNADQLRAMIGDLLDATRAETGKLALSPRPVCVSDLVYDVLQTLQPSAEAKNISLLLLVPPPGAAGAAALPRVQADPARVRQVLTNLIENALKFTPRGGTVTAGSRLCSDPDFVCVSVRDTGCGLDPQNTERIFERLYQEPGAATQTSRKGLGLGLYICREIVVRHGGRIWAESDLGQGSTFSFTLPRAPAAAAPAAAPAA